MLAISENIEIEYLHENNQIRSLFQLVFLQRFQKVLITCFSRLAEILSGDTRKILGIGLCNKARFLNENYLRNFIADWSIGRASKFKILIGKFTCDLSPWQFRVKCIYITQLTLYKNIVHYFNFTFCYLPCMLLKNVIFNEHIFVNLMVQTCKQMEK